MNKIGKDIYSAAGEMVSSEQVELFQSPDFAKQLGETVKAGIAEHGPDIAVVCFSYMGKAELQAIPRTDAWPLVVKFQEGMTNVLRAFGQEPDMNEMAPIRERLENPAVDGFWLVSLFPLAIGCGRVRMVDTSDFNARGGSA